MITGRKVRLRSLREDDLKNAFATMNNSAVTRYLRFMRPWSVVEEKAWIERAMKNDDPTLVNLAIETTDGEYVGATGLMQIDPRNRDAELGIVIGRPEDWGRGLGTEATLLLLRHAFEELNLHRVHLRVFDYNERARKSYKKLGFEEEGRLREAHYRHGAWHDVVIMGILAEEFYAKHGKTDDGKVKDMSEGR
ncbi:MAG: GNAT family N-acetyltransferase [Candidatus Eiseniibacteriota bacterium]